MKLPKFKKNNSSAKAVEELEALRDAILSNSEQINHLKKSQWGLENPPEYEKDNIVLIVYPSYCYGAKILHEIGPYWDMGCSTYYYKYRIETNHGCSENTTRVLTVEENAIYPLDKIKSMENTLNESVAKLINQEGK